jgi:hypothetical protein
MKIAERLRQPETLLLSGILLLGTVLRLIHLNDLSFSNDELSAVWRCRYDSLGDVLRYGVKEGDMHPAGVQVFMWLWIKLGGNGEFWVRLPFVLSSMVATYFVFRLGKSLFDPFTGLLAAGLFSTLEYSLHLGQLARPYAPGVMLVMMNAYCWTRIVLRHDARLKHYVFYGLTLAAAAYVHYYALVTLAIVAVSGIFFLERREILWYGAAGLGALLLFLPHLGILNYQMGIGGLQGWLGKPDKGWLRDYLHQALNSSDFFSLVCITSLAAGLFFNFRQNRTAFPYVITLLWFGTAFLFGYLYSLLKSPILHAYPLFFAFPFLVLFSSALVINPDRKRISMAIVVFLTVGSAASTVIERNYYTAHRVGTFREIAEAFNEWQTELGPENVDCAGNFNDPYYIHYYLDQTDFSDSLLLYQHEDLNDLDKLYDAVTLSGKNHFAFGWSTRSTPMLTYEIIRLKYPVIVDDRKFENSRVTLFGKGERQSEAVFQNDFIPGESYRGWEHNLETVRSDSTGDYVFLNSELAFSPVFRSTVSGIRLQEDRYIVVEAEVERLGEPKPFHLVFQLERDGALIERFDQKSWFAVDVNEVYPVRSQKQTYVFARTWEDWMNPTDVVKVMVWNNGGGELRISRIQVLVENK